MLAEEDHSVMCLLLKRAYQVKKSTNYSTFVSPKLRELSSFPKRHHLHVLRRLLCQTFRNTGVEGGGGIPNGSDTDAHPLASHGEGARKKAVRTSAWEATHCLV